MITKKQVLAWAKEDIQKNGSYVIPKYNPSYMTKKEGSDFKEEMKVAHQLVNKGILEICSDDRRATDFVIAGSIVDNNEESISYIDLRPQRNHPRKKQRFIP